MVTALRPQDWGGQAGLPREAQFSWVTHRVHEKLLSVLLWGESMTAEGGGWGEEFWVTGVGWDWEGDAGWGWGGWGGGG